MESPRKIANNKYRQDRLIEEKKMCEYEKSICDIMLDMLKNNELACSIRVGKLEMSVCNNSKLIPAVKHHVKELQKFIDGEPNEYK